MCYRNDLCGPRALQKELCTSNMKALCLVTAASDHIGAVKEVGASVVLPPPSFAHPSSPDEIT